MTPPDLPISDVLPALMEAVKATGKAVLQAPPGAGKTTVVPLALLDSGLVAGRIIMLEPRRLAARAAAERMASTLGQKPGQTVGYRIRGDVKSGAETRIEVVTEGILTRIIQSDPDLPGIGAVIFDEFHERSLNADLGLALTLELREALRPDLTLIIMSATLDAQPVADMIGAPTITSDGRAFPVETRWLDRPAPANERMEDTATGLILTALAETEGGVLVFLPGEGEIRRVADRLADKIPADVVIQPLFGAMPFAQQRAAIQPLDKGRKLVLATAIAETSLTIQDVRVVVDCGLSRRARFDHGTGMSRLVTERVTRAEAEQRRGRAGRVAPGWCYRMWTRAAEGGLAPFPPPEIEVGDLSGLVLDVALWGGQASDMAFVTPPSQAGLDGAKRLLTDLGALDDAGRITEHGRALAALPVHPRLAHMLARGGKGAAGLAAILSERLPILPEGVDLLATKRLLSTPGHPTISNLFKRLDKLASPDAGLSWAELVATAYPDRVGKRRPGDDPRYVLSGGRGAVMDAGDALAGAQLIVVTDIDDKGREGRIRRAIAVTESELENVMADRIMWVSDCRWSKRDGRVLATEQRRLGAVVLAERVWKSAPPEALARAALDGFRDLGLTFSRAADNLRKRVAFLRASGVEMPDMTDQGLIDGIESWLLPNLDPPPRNAQEIKGFDLLPALRSMLDWTQTDQLNRLAPPRYTAPTGRAVTVDYAGDLPEIEIRLQEMFGQTSHPIVAGQPLRLTLLSPAGRPLQTTADLPGFWANSYADVRKDMRGRYPKHPWPEDPASAAPTTRAKPRKA